MAFNLEFSKRFPILDFKILNVMNHANFLKIFFSILSFERELKLLIEIAHLNLFFNSLDD